MISVATKNIMLTLVRRRTSSWYFGCLSTSETILSDTFYSPCYGILALGSTQRLLGHRKAGAGVRNAEFDIKRACQLRAIHLLEWRGLNVFCSTVLPKPSASEPGPAGRRFSGRRSVMLRGRVYSKSLRTRRTWMPASTQ